MWVVTGDGDGLSIGGNHLIHALRRNVNITILLFNNRIYGLTKGQYSPTSEEGKVTKSTPLGSVDHPFNPLSLALGAEATFVGRALDSDRKGLASVLRAAAAHRGASFVEILPGLPDLDDGSFDVLRKDESEDRLIRVEHDQPIRFGSEGQHCGCAPASGYGREDPRGGCGRGVVVHDAYTDDPEYAYALARLSDQGLKHVVTGIFRDTVRPTYDDAARAQVAAEREQHPVTDTALQDLLTGRETWTVR